LIEPLIPHLDPGDIIIDGGNAHFEDSIRRTRYLEGKGLLFIGTGVSGGEEGALTGPSIMPGGSAAAWPAVKPIFQGIAARVEDGTSCCEWVGADGAGHFVKMVHNGIEYGDMQLICEAYQIMKELLGMSPAQMSDVFAEWNQGELDSYLMEITRDILAFEEDGEPLVEKILDTAGQKGTGKWTAISALELGIPLTLIGEAVFARFLSAQKEKRAQASRVLKGPAPLRRRPASLYRGHSTSPARLQDRVLRPGLPAAVALLQRKGRCRPGRLAARGRGGGQSRNPLAIADARAQLFRRLPLATPARQPAAGAKGLFWCT